MEYNILYCSLCGKNYNDVNKLITADGVTLCDACYVFCASQEDSDEKSRNPEDSENCKQKESAM
ncbi:MAG: ClpX C4-type zinc finger protein [Desulfobacterales bacterium]